MNLLCIITFYFCPQSQETIKTIGYEKGNDAFGNRQSHESRGFQLGFRYQISQQLDKSPAEWLRRYYSTVLEKEVSYRQASSITQAQLAFVLALFTSTDVMLAKAIFAAWFAVSVYRCKKTGV